MLPLMCLMIVYYMKYYNAYLHLFLNIISLVYYLYLLLYHFYYILSEYLLVHTGIPRRLTCISIGTHGIVHWGYTQKWYTAPCSPLMTLFFHLLLYLLISDL